MRTWPQTDWSLRIDGINPYDTNLLYHHQPIRELYTSLSHTCDSLTHFALKKKKKKGSLFWNLLGNLDLLSPYDSLYVSVINAACFVAQLVKNPPAVWNTLVWFLRFPRRRDRLPTPVFLGFSGGSSRKGSACNVGDLGSIPGLGRSLGEMNSHPLQYFGLENSMDHIVHGYSLQTVG